MLPYEKDDLEVHVVIGLKMFREGRERGVGWTMVVNQGMIDGINETLGILLKSTTGLHQKVDQLLAENHALKREIAVLKENETGDLGVGVSIGRATKKTEV